MGSIDLLFLVFVIVVSWKENLQKNFQFPHKMNSFSPRKIKERKKSTNVVFD